MNIKRLVIAVLLAVSAGGTARAETPQLIGRLTIPVLPLSARVESWALDVERNAPGQVRIVFTLGDQELSDTEVASRFKGCHVTAELSGPGLVEPLVLSRPGTAPSHPVALQIPALSQNGTYLLSNIRVIRNGRAIVVNPGSMVVRVVDPVATPTPSGIVVR